MITQEQYDQLNEGDTLIARFEATRIGEFEAKGTVYVGPYSREKSLAGWTLHPGMHGDHWTIIEHIPAAPAWHSAQVISAAGNDGVRAVHVRYPLLPDLWVRIGDWRFIHTQSLRDVTELLMGKDVEL
jgi:hypothetical protein